MFVFNAGYNGLAKRIFRKYRFIAIEPARLYTRRKYSAAESTFMASATRILCYCIDASSRLVFDVPIDT
ncbi:hypothetical protein [Steroidobacter denitrificans]|uniref:hypothetical protein n=1 Tax=Steroidobacter denitrificans TaxID=465721 RepID=UPI001AEF65CA|nr:hypothetical protein [Steroidobacter denitrificans]